MEPVYIAVADLRNVLIVDRNEAARIGPDLGPILGRIFVHMCEHWDVIHEDPELVADTTGPISACEGLLKRIADALGVRPPGTSLRQRLRISG